jgi:DNA polymerase-3 subunit alpha
VEVAASEIEVEDDPDVAFLEDNEGSDNDNETNTDVITTTKLKVEEIEEIKVVTKLTMPSRKLKIKISNELLQELDKMQINFKLN